MNRLNIICLLILLIISNNSDAQSSFSHRIVINEIMASNASTKTDQNKNYSDWIELFNPSEHEIRLNQFYLSDDRNNLTKSRLPDTLLLPGEYILLWASGNDSLVHHLDFKLNKNAEGIYLTKADGITIIDKIEYEQQLPDISYCRINNQWLYSKNPTPGYQNDLENTYRQISEKLQISFNRTKKGIKCEINQNHSGEIYYTTDGSKPNTENATKYERPFYMDSAVIVRAIQAGNHLLNHGESSAFFLENTDHTLPIVSLVTDPKNLYDPDFGIFIQGNNYNYNKRTDDYIHEGSISYYKNQKLIADYNIDFKIYGAGTRKLPKKSMSITAQGKMKDHFFDSNNTDLIDGFVLRAIYTNHTRFKNETVNGVNSLMGKKTLTQEIHPCVLYVNGQYWGLYHITERKNKDFIENHYQAKVKDLLDANIIQARVIKGTLQEYELLLDTLAQINMNNPLAFTFLNEKIDLLSFSDFWIHELYTVKMDRHNNRFWKSEGDTAKWRYVSYDFDAGLKKANSTNFIKNISDSIPAGVNIFGCLMQNPEFKALFFQRLCDYINFGYTYDNVAKILSQFDSLTRDEFKKDYLRWNEEMDNLTDIGDFQKSRILKFINARNDYILFALAPYLDFHHTVKISNPDQDKGEIWINGHLLTGEAVYFAGMEIEIIIKAKDGFKFIDWSNTKIKTKANKILILNNYKEIKPIFK